MHDSILQSIGRTPLVRLRRLADGRAGDGLRQGRVAQPRRQRQGPRRPGHDRRGRAARLAAARRHHHRGHRRQHRRRPGHGRRRQGLPLHLRPARQDVAARRSRCSKAYGAEVVITPTNVAPDSPESYNGVADRLAREIPGAWRPNQFTNLANPEIHYRTTGPEIWEQTEGRITVFVAGVGTGGTISGVARYLKERNPDIKIIGADPEGTVLSGGSPQAVEGRGHRRGLRAQDVQQPARR